MPRALVHASLTGTLLLASGCNCRDPESIALTAVQSQGVARVELFPAGAEPASDQEGSWRFEGKKGEHDCTGEVEVRAFDDAGSAKLDMLCLPPPGAITGKLPPGTAQDLVKLARRCDGADAKACAELGVHYERGDGVPKDLDYAAGLWGEACREGAGLACHSLALLLEASGTEPAAITKMEVEACDLGWGPACGQAARRLYNDDMRRDNEAMVRTSRRGCESDDADACMILGILLAHGVEVGRDMAAARKALMQACGKGKEPACTLVEEL